MIAQGSLFDQPERPVAENAGGWIVELLSGPAATSLCVIAVAILGMMILTGRLPLRRGMQVVLGCFVLLGAATIATGLQAFGDNARDERSGELVIFPEDDLASRRPLPPANYDPYAGASLRRR
ncbi:MAG TPA: TrbC/VirB2 family protein [Sphingomonadaceae bacterium]|nr:TrbC/VirB2 family protein [Sphingomonadaceae bacterium]